MKQKSNKGWNNDDGPESWEERFSLPVNFTEPLREEEVIMSNGPPIRKWLLALSLYIYGQLRQLTYTSHFLLLGIKWLGLYEVSEKNLKNWKFEY